MIPVAGLGWFLLGADHELDESREDPIPAYMAQRALLGPEHGVLVVRGSVADGLDYHVRRGDGTTIGEDEVLALRTEDATFVSDLTELLSRPTASSVAALADHGIEYVVMPAPADGTVAAGLDATGGLSAASAEDRATRAWQVERPLRAGRRVGSRVLAAHRPARPAGAGRPRHRGARGPVDREAAAMRTRFDPLLGLAVALPVLAVTSLALHDPVRPAQAERPPFEVTLDRATVVCPSAIGRQRGVVVLTPRTDREVRPARAAGPFVDIVEGAGAPGLLAGRFARPTAAADCGPPVPEQWYTGLEQPLATTRSSSSSTPTRDPRSPTSSSTGAPGSSTPPSCAASRCRARGASGSTSPRFCPAATSWPCR